MSNNLSFGIGGGGAGFNFKPAGGTSTSIAPSTGTSGFSFGLSSIPKTASASTAASSTAGAKMPNFSFSSKTTTTNQPSTGLFGAPASTASSSLTSASKGFNLGSTSINSSLASTASQSSFALPQSAVITTTTLTTTFGAVGSGGSANLSMRQLEEKMNKWLVELKEQEERFLRQVSHVNAWDLILHKGHEEVHDLKNILNTVKSHQSRMEAEIDFIRSQQDELESLLEPLESVVAANSASQMHQGDRQRDNMYYLAQSLDAQLRQMTDNLGKVIEHLNSGGESTTPNDPLSMITKILSAHIDTLKWVDQNVGALSQKVDEIGRLSGASGKRLT